VKRYAERGGELKFAPAIPLQQSSQIDTPLDFGGRTLAAATEYCRIRS